MELEQFKEIMSQDKLEYETDRCHFTIGLNILYKYLDGPCIREVDEDGIDCCEICNLLPDISKEDVMELRDLGFWVYDAYGCLYYSNVDITLQSQ